MTSKPIIQIQHLSKSFTVKGSTFDALEDINLDIYPGEIFGIIGLSGAGKSTLVRCINYLERPTGGKVIFDGRDLSTLSNKELCTARQSMGMIFQQFNLPMQRTALKNICFPLEIAGIPKAEARQRAEELLELVGLSDQANAYPAQLSGGQKQRVAIAGVLALEPKCIVLDEPTAMLDPQGRKEIVTTVKKLNREKGITVVYITHYMEEALQADRIIVMGEGKLKMQGTPKEVFSHVRELYALGLEAPLAAKIADDLRQSGLNLQQGIITNEELAESICR